MCDIFHPDEECFWYGYESGREWATQRASEMEIERLHEFFESNDMGGFMYNEIDLPYHLLIATVALGGIAFTRQEALDSWYNMVGNNAPGVVRPDFVIGFVCGSMEYGCPFEDHQWHRFDWELDDEDDGEDSDIENIEDEVVGIDRTEEIFASQHGLDQEARLVRGDSAQAKATSGNSDETMFEGRQLRSIELDSDKDVPAVACRRHGSRDIHGRAVPDGEQSAGPEEASFTLTTRQLVDILNCLPSGTRFYECSSARRESLRYIGTRDEVIRVFSNPVQDPYPPAWNSEDGRHILCGVSFVSERSISSSEVSDHGEYVVLLDVRLEGEDENLPQM